jgi:hypothetical protein
VEAFRATVEAGRAFAGASPWTGRVLVGDMVEYGDGGSYLEPDIQKAKGLLQATGATTAATTGVLS